MEKIEAYFDIRPAILKGETTCLSLVKQCLENIQKQEHLNAFVRVYAEEAQQRAVEVDQKIKDGTAGKLAGLIVGIKDVICYKDHPLQASSKILDGFVSQFSATCVERLLAEDAIIIGHQNCDQFAMGSSNEYSIYGPVKNAIDTTKVPGGSSGGSAVAVQAGMCHVSLGTDTGGSVRQPAALCGIVGLKPTYSRVSRNGLVAYASSFDTLSVFSQNIPDCALLMEVVAGVDEHDNTSSSHEVPAYSQSLAFGQKIKIAYLEDAIHHDGLQPEIQEHTLSAIEKLREEGHTVEGVRFPLLDYILPTYYILTTAEASANLARFDGIQFGHRSKNASTLEEMYVNTRTEGFGEEVQRRILLGTFILSSDYYDSYYLKAQKVRRLIKEATEKILSEYEFIILPTTPTTAFPLADGPRDPITTYLEDLYTVQAPMSGLPGISIPNGVDKQNLPIGLQIMSGAFKEDKLLAFSQYLLKLLPS